MPLYQQFADVYQSGPYLRFSQRVAETALPDMLEHLDFSPETLLDVACGEGTFAVMMAQAGYRVSGVDQSEAMITLARSRAKEACVQVDFRVEDMRSLPFEAEFDLVTCLFDSLNYMLTIRDLQEAFLSAFRALRPGGYYLFDMNTIYGLAVDWMREKTYVQNETDDFIELHRHDFDYENLIASMEIMVFKRHGKHWERIVELHQERGYPLVDIQFLLQQVGFDVYGIYGRLSERSMVQTTSPRAWFAAQKPSQ
jgi:SAM-dependent methyltransferase